MPDSEDKITSPDALMAMTMAFQRSRIVLTAHELDLFTSVGDGATSSEAAAAMGTDGRATDRLMNALCAVGLLEKRDGVFYNTGFSGRFLVKNSPAYMAGLMHTVHLWDTWSTLTDAVRKGSTVFDNPLLGRDDDWFRAFIAAMHQRARRSAAQVVSLLDLSGVSRVLDVGGGSAAYAMAFARARDGVSAVVFDLPKVTPLARRYIAEEGLSGRVSTVEGDYHSDPFPGGFDLVFLSAVVHINSPEENVALIRKSADALNPDGQVVVQDFIMDEDRTTPPFGAIFALNMLVGTKCGDTFTEAETAGWMKAAGLGGIRRIDTPAGTALVVGRKTG